MSYDGDFSTYAGNYNVGKRNLDEEITLIRYFSTASNPLSSTGVYKLFAVPAGFCITKAYVVCETAEGGTGTIDIVDDDIVSTTIVNDANVNSANAVTANTARRYYPSGGYICVLANNDLDAAKFYVVVRGIILDTNM